MGVCMWDVLKSHLYSSSNYFFDQSFDDSVKFQRSIIWLNYSLITQGTGGCQLSLTFCWQYLQWELLSKIRAKWNLCVLSNSRINWDKRDSNLYLQSYMTSTGCGVSQFTQPLFEKRQHRQTLDLSFDWYVLLQLRRLPKTRIKCWTLCYIS